MGALTPEIFNKNAKDIVDHLYYEVKWWEIWPPKREPPDFSIFIEISKLASRLEAVEGYLEKDIGAGKSFVRSQERPMVGAEILQKITQTVELLGSRLEEVERRLQGKG